MRTCYPLTYSLPPACEAANPLLRQGDSKVSRPFIYALGTLSSLGEEILKNQGDLKAKKSNVSPAAKASGRSVGAVRCRAPDSHSQPSIPGARRSRWRGPVLLKEGRLSRGRPLGGR